MNTKPTVRKYGSSTKKNLEKLGLSVSINASVKEKVEMEMEDNTDQALKEVSTRLVDIKT